jgi:hypothetical protein
MSAKIFAKPAEWSELKTSPAMQRIWEAAELNKNADASVQGPPVQVRLRDGLAELSVNGGFEMQVLEDRDLLLQCGQTLFHLKLVLQRFGHMAQVQFFPDLDQLSLVARIPCKFSCDPKALRFLAVEDLFRHRREFISTSQVPVSNQMLARLSMVGNGRAWLDFSQSGLSRQQLCDIEISSHPDSRYGSSYRGESLPQKAATGPRLRDAIAGALGFLGASRIGSLLLGPPTRTLAKAPERRDPDLGKKIYEMASLAVLKTKTDDRYGWLAAGEVMERARLEAQTLGISSQVFDHAFRGRRPRQELRNIIGRKGFVQAIIGFGSRLATDFASLPSQPPAPATESQIQMTMS